METKNNAGNNIFNGNKILYTMIDGEVYAVQILDMYMPVDNVIPIIDGNTIALSKILSIRLKITEKGTKVYNKNNFELSIKQLGDLLCNTYKTIDDCIYKMHPIFKFNEAREIELVEPLQYNMETLCPEKAKWGTQYDGTFTLETWGWDGTKPVKCYFNSPSNEGIAWGNQHRTPLYNAVKDKWLVNSEYYKQLYPTFDACLNAHSIKVHLF